MILSQALEWAEKAHQNQTRPNGSTPFITHPLAVCALVLQYGGTQEQAAAALLHDTLNTRKISRDQVQEQFGSEIARLVAAFEDLPSLSPQNSQDWGTEKKYYLNKIRELDESIVWVVGCEELHELTELLYGIRNFSPSIWSQYPTHPMNLGWYYKEIFQILYRKLSPQPLGKKLLSEYATALKQLQEIVFESAGV